MKNERILHAIGDADERFIVEAAPENKSGKKRLKVAKWLIAACFGLVIIGAVALLLPEKDVIDLSYRSHDVTVRYAENAPVSMSSNELIWLTEEEIFTRWNTAIFKGAVTEINNIEIDFNDDKVYRALATISVEEVYRGNLSTGDSVEALLPCPISKHIWVEDTEIISQIKVGMKGIFMPIRYDSDSIWEQNGGILCLADIADYGFLDGMRYAFLETSRGLLFEKWSAYKSIEDAKTLDDIEKYVIMMIEKTKQ